MKKMKMKMEDCITLSLVDKWIRFLGSKKEEKAVDAPKEDEKKEDAPVESEKKE